MSGIENIRTADQLDRLLADSDRVPVWIFKHSLACGVSGHALKEFERFVASLDTDDPAHFALVEIQQAPDISREISSRTGVRHESPQLIFLHNGRVVWEASHWSIRRKALDRARVENLGSDLASDDGGAS
jgi:bacillithiol system protein YtxJ